MTTNDEAKPQRHDTDAYARCRRCGTYTDGPHDPVCRCDDEHEAAELDRLARLKDEGALGRWRPPSED